MSTLFHLQIPAAVYQDMISQAIAESPNECCGLLAGHIHNDDSGPIGLVVQRYPLVNAAASRVEYLSDARSMLGADKDMRRQGIEILAVYHSHPASEPIPSRTDLERNYSTEVMNLIISLKGKEPVVRGWWLTAEEYREGEWECMEG